MEKEIVAGEIGSEANYKVEIKEGKLQASLVYQGKQAGVGANVNIGIGAVLDAIKEAIPGHFDDALIDGAKKLLGV